jgi:hypothetical protein
MVVRDGASRSTVRKWEARQDRTRSVLDVLYTGYCCPSGDLGESPRVHLGVILLRAKKPGVYS